MANGEARGLDSLLYRIITASDMRYPYHIHRTYEILRVLRGTVSVRVDEKDGIAQEGQVVVIFPFQYHQFTVDSRSQVQIYLCSPEFIPEFHTAMNGKIPEHPIAELDPEIDKLCHSDRLLSVKAFFYAAFDHLQQTLSLRDVPIQGGKQRIEDILLYIDAHYADECSLHDAARQFGCSYTYLSRYFKKQTGVGFHTYLADYRVGKACYLLTNTDLPITIISEAVGFDSIRTFNRDFMRNMKVSPTNYRNQILL